MKLFEVDEKINLKDSDLNDDLMFFMYNDDKFYRRMLYPTIHNFVEKIKGKQACKDNYFRGCVDSACKIYCNKYDIKDGEKSVFTDVDRDEVARQIFGQERDRCEQGDYNKE